MKTIEDLLIVAGPSRVGKTTFIDTRTDYLAGIYSDALQGSSPKDWQCKSPRDLLNCVAKREQLGAVILHYDICFQFFDNNFETLDEIVAAAEKVAVVTLFCRRDLLFKRNLARLSIRLKNVLRGGIDKTSRRRLLGTMRLVWVYMSQSRTGVVIDSWLESISRYDTKVHLHLDSCSGAVLRGNSLDVKKMVVGESSCKKT